MCEEIGEGKITCYWIVLVFLVDDQGSERDSVV